MNAARLAAVACAWRPWASRSRAIETDSRPTWATRSATCAASDRPGRRPPWAICNAAAQRRASRGPRDRPSTALPSGSVVVPRRLRQRAIGVALDQPARRSQHLRGCGAVSPEPTGAPFVAVSISRRTSSAACAAAPEACSHSARAAGCTAIPRLGGFVADGGPARQQPRQTQVGCELPAAEQHRLPRWFPAPDGVARQPPVRFPPLPHDHTRGPEPVQKLSRLPSPSSGVLDLPAQPVPRRQHLPAPAGLLHLKQRLANALEKISTLWIGVHCRLDIAVNREANRPDRITGMAASQASAVHRGVKYDLEIDTTDRTPSNCARDILGSIAKLTGTR